MQLTVCLILKKNKKYNKKIIKFLKNFIYKLDVFYGEVGQKLPKKIKKKRYDFLISYLSPWIINHKILKRTKFYNINFHPGPPKYPGIGCFNFALLNNDNSYGVTMHLMNKSVDSGKIIKTQYFSIKNLNLIEIIDKSYDEMFKLFTKEILKILKTKKINLSKEKWKRTAYTRKDLNKLLKLNLNMKPKEITNRINALYYQGYPNPYFTINNKKFYVIPEKNS
tara:strand:- start:6920 stop:7588 length:669 start_codon:yes stop_codon:yes gene_type:complete